jgi:hypothetical protein
VANLAGTMERKLRYVMSVHLFSGTGLGLTILVSLVTVASTAAQNAKNRIFNGVVQGTTSPTASAPTLTIPSADRKSAYTNEWKPYIAANLFLYTVPLAIFLRRARELDFSQRELSRSRTLVKRVFRVFAPDVINALNELTSSVNRPDASISSLWQTANNHRSLLGDFAPTTSGDLSLSSCQGEMQGLLEEMHMQHMKTVRDLGTLDKIAAMLEGFFGKGVVSGDETALQSLVERAKLIVGLPIDYEVLPSDPGKAGFGKSHLVAGDSTAALRDAQGNLTAEGRKQLLSGNLLLSPSDVHFIGDPLRARRTSYEIPFLVPITIELSDRLNKKFGWEKGWNLRFLADYRNLLFGCICFLLLRMISCIVF